MYLVKVSILGVVFWCMAVRSGVRGSELSSGGTVCHHVNNKVIFSGLSKGSRKKSYFF